jgi:hypothetical protein
MIELVVGDAHTLLLTRLCVCVYVYPTSKMPSAYRGAGHLLSGDWEGGKKGNGNDVASQ